MSSSTEWSFGDVSKLGEGLEQLGQNIKVASDKLGQDIQDSTEAIGKNIDEGCKNLQAKLAEDIENTRKTVEEQISTSKTSSIEEPTEDTKKPYSNPLFDIPGEALDNAIFGPYYRSRLDTTDANTAALIDSGALNMPILKMLNIPKCILFASSTFTGALAVYSLVRSKSASVFVVASIISHETLRLSYNMYLTNTISLLAKKLMAEPEMVGEAIKGVLTAKAEQTVSDSLKSMGISDSILGENRTDGSKVITDFAKALLPKVLLDQTLIASILSLFGSKTKAKRS